MSRAFSPLAFVTFVRGASPLAGMNRAVGTVPLMRSEDKQQQIPCGNDRKKSKSNGKARSRSFATLRMTILIEGWQFK